jgi:hypothetical protein
MNNPRRTKVPLETIDLLILRAVAAVFGTVVFLLLFFSRYWPWYLWLLDVRIWPPWKCIGIGVVLAESLLVIHLWPTKKRQKRAMGAGGSEAHLPSAPSTKAP